MRLVGDRSLLNEAMTAFEEGKSWAAKKSAEDGRKKKVGPTTRIDLREIGLKLPIFKPEENSTSPPKKRAICREVSLPVYTIAHAVGEKLRIKQLKEKFEPEENKTNKNGIMCKPDTPMAERLALEHEQTVQYERIDGG